MSEKYFVGNDITSFSDNGKYKPISRVTLLVDDENSLTAGDDTGMELVASCPHATQSMVNSLLQTVKGYQYQAYEAGAANIDPAAELGDGVTVGGVYSPLSKIIDNGRGYADISSPGEMEMEDEYPSEGYIAQEFNRKIAETRSAITKTSEEINLEIQGVDGRVSTLQLTVQGIESQVSDAQGNISTLQQTAQSLQSQVNGKIDGDDAQTLINQTLEGISLSVSGTDGSTTFEIKQGSVTLDSTTFDLHVSSVNIEGTLTADEIRGSTFELLDDGDDIAATFYLTGASSYSGRKIVIDSGAIEINSSYGDLYLSGRDGLSSLDFGSYEIGCLGTFYPNSDSRYNLGASNYRWDTVYATTSAIDTSDVNRKNSIADLPQNLIDMLDGMIPRVFKLNSGTSNRFHAGFIAQEVKAQMDKHGISATDFAGWCCDIDENGEEIQSLRYSEFIPILLAKLQQIDKRLKALEGIA